MTTTEAVVCAYCEQSPSMAYWRKKSEDMLFCTIRCECCGIKCEGAESVATFEARKYYKHMGAEIAVTKWNAFMAKAKKAMEAKA